MWEIYLIEQADSLKDAIFILSLGMAGYIAITILYYFIEERTIPKYLRSYLLPMLLSLVVLYASIPSTKSCYMIFGLGKTLDYLKESDEAKKLPENTLKLINNSLEKLNEKLEDKNDK